MHRPMNVKNINMLYVCGKVLACDKRISIFDVSPISKKYIIVKLD